MSNYLTTELMLAAERGDALQVQTLLKQGADPNAIGLLTGTLHSAVLMGHKAVVKNLLAAGANPNLKDAQNFYPLHLAASKGFTAICNLLLKYKADKNIRTELGQTALHLAASQGFSLTLAALVKSGFDLEAVDLDGNTPLAVASMEGQLNIVKSLIKAGALVNPKDNKGATPLMQSLWLLLDTRVDDWSYEALEGAVPVRYQLNKGCFRIINNYNKYQKQLGRLMSLKEQKDYVKKDLCPKEHGVYLAALEIVKILLKAGAIVEYKNKEGISPLRVACYAGVGELIQLLIKAGASLDKERWESGATELHHVAGSGRLDGLEAFFRRAENFQINAVDDYGWTAAHYLADAGGPVEMALLLKKYQADLSLESTRKTPNFPKSIRAAKVALHWKDMDLAMALDY